MLCCSCRPARRREARPNRANAATGRIVQSEAADVLFITRLQGVPGCYRQIQSAKKTMYDVGPSAVLVAALSGIAKAFGLHEMAGVQATRHVSYNEKFANHFAEAYDNFFRELEAAQNPSGFFICPMPPLEKPLVLVKKGHKLRTREKRAFKRQLAEQVYRSFQEAAGRVADAPQAP